MWWWWWWGRLQLKITRSVMIKHTCHATHWYIVNDSWMVGWGAVKKTFEWLNWLNVFEGIGFGWSIILQITFMRKKTKKWEQLNPPKPLTNDGRQSPHVSRGREQVSRHAFFHRLRHRTVPNCALVGQCVTVCDSVWHCSKAELSFFRGKLTTLVLPLLLTTSRQPVNKGWTGTFFSGFGHVWIVRVYFGEFQNQTSNRFFTNGK